MNECSGTCNVVTESPSSNIFGYSLSVIGIAYSDIVCPVVDACVELDCSWCLDNATMEHITPGICSSCMVSELSYGDADGIKCKSMCLSIAHSDTI